MTSVSQQTLALLAYKLTPVPLSAASQPILIDDGEVYLRIADNVAFHSKHPDSHSASQELLNSGLFILSNFRMMVVCKSRVDSTSIGWGISLSEIDSVNDCSTFFSRSTRLKISIKGVDETLQVKFENYSEKDDIIGHFRTALQKRSWEALVMSKPNTSQQTGFSVTNAGLAGIQRRQDENLRKIDSLARDAVADLDALMNHAREVVAVIQKYASLGGAEETGLGSETASETGEISEVESIMQTIGIASPVTKYSAGRLYHQQLSRQLADFLLERNRLKNLGGMATATDMYCLFNRARGTELVSPEDFLCASELLVGLKLGLAMKRFHSGVIAIRLDEVNEDVLCSRVVELCRSSSSCSSLIGVADKEMKKEGMQPSFVAKKLNISMIIANEVLLLAEEKALLCRDESVAGTFFYENLFPSFEVQR
jgi:ESCRT-II complex subunit VPS36